MDSKLYWCPYCQELNKVHIPTWKEEIKKQVTANLPANLGKAAATEVADVMVAEKAGAVAGKKAGLALGAIFLVYGFVKYYDAHLITCGNQECRQQFRIPLIQTANN